MFLVQLQDVLQKQLSGKFTKQVYDIQVLEGTGQAQGHTVRSRIERRGLGALPIWDDAHLIDGRIEKWGFRALLPK